MPWITAEQALERLGTKPQTLYANVSRGRIQAKPDPGDTRRSLYRREDVERLAERNHGRRRAASVAAQTIAWGDPLLPTAISTVIDGLLSFRGQDAVTLSQTADLETVAALLWDCPNTGFPAGEPIAAGGGLVAAFSVLARLAATDLPTLGRSPKILQRDAGRVVGSLVSAVTGSSRHDGPVHERLATFWDRPDAADAIRRALVLMAEHELNASTFAARVTASTGAALSAAVLSGLAALGGPRHGGASASMQDLVELAERRGAEGAVQSYLGQGRPLPCFGHRLYPDGDIRALALLQHIDIPPVYAALAQTGESIVGEKPNVDFALAAMAASHALPATAPMLLFALSRSVGWIAHALEQIQSGALIRPRANYVGLPPTPPAAPAAISA